MCQRVCSEGANSLAALLMIGQSMCLTSLLWPRNIIFVKFRGLCPDAGLRYHCIAGPVLCRPDIHRHDWKDCVNNQSFTGCLLFRSSCAYADDASVGSQKESEKWSEQGQRRGQNRVREGVRTGSEKGSEQDQKWSEQDQRRRQNRIRRGSEQDQKASERDQKGSEQD